ncbi:MAG: hypothetical protein AAFQ51_13765 [Pseudomonadota bacterium]
MNFLGASIIAGVIYFILSFFSTLWLEGPQVTEMYALITAAIKTAVFVTLFHYLHNFIAKQLRWYRTDDPDAKHRFDKTPGMDVPHVPQGEK